MDGVWFIILSFFIMLVTLVLGALGAFHKDGSITLSYCICKIALQSFLKTNRNIKTGFAKKFSSLTYWVSPS